MELVYVADPMCSWCYGFAPVLARAASALPASVPLRYLMGGLAEDSDEPMPAATSRMIQGAWNTIERVTSVSFNREFWTRCQPRRSTYPACRAVIAAEALSIGAGSAMFSGIQRAYYQEAQNPSDVPVLADVAKSIQLSRNDFIKRMLSEKTETELQKQLRERARLGVEVGVAGFPALVLKSSDGDVQLLTSGYCSWGELSPRLEAGLASAGG
ncbi:MAG: DsbA family protein [Planctomycetota bacterium]